MKNNLTLGSLFDGSGGFPLAGMLSGITPVWASEVEPFAVRVTTKRLPFVQHLGDVTKINGGEIPPVDIITFGSPCQDMSLAGKREGLQGSRSSLFFEAIRIVKEMRKKSDGKYPRYVVWENVFGAFSSNGGEDFKAVLEAFIGIVCKDAEVPLPEKGRWCYADVLMGDGWSVAYRTLDAQYWGVPQRRRRIFLVADLGGCSAGDILFKSEGLSRYSAQGFHAWQKTAGNIAPGIGEAGCDLAFDNEAFHLNQRDEAINLKGIAGSLMATRHTQMQTFIVSENAHQIVPLDYNPCDSRIGLAEKMQTLTHRMGTGGNNVPLVLEDEATPKLLKIRSGCEGGGKGALLQDNKSATIGCNNDQTLFEPKVFGISSDKSNAMLSSNPNSGIYEAGTSRTLDVAGGNPSCNQGGIAIVENYGFYPQLKAESVSLCKEKANCLINGTNPGWQNGLLTVAVEGNGARPSHKGDGYKETAKMYTLNTVEVHSVAYDEKSSTYATTTGNFTQVEEDVSPTLMARDYKDPIAVVEKLDKQAAYGLARGAFCAGYNSEFSFSVEEELEPTIIASGPGAVAKMELNPKISGTVATGAHPSGFNGQDAYNDRLVVDPVTSQYIVRRLTPTECAKLQGFPEWWCKCLGGEPTDEEVTFFTKVFETHRQLMGTSSKPKTEKQIRKWLANPHTDSAEYKLWGNGVALPCVFFVLAGIEYYNRLESIHK